MSKMKKILIVTCSKDDGKNTPLVRSLSVLKNDVTVVVNANNDVGLSKAYNRQLVADNLIKHDIALFVHDDVYIDDLKLKGKLYTAIDNLGYDIVGLAGAKTMKLGEPYLWHRMSSQQDWSGAVSHPVSDGKAMVTSFGPWPERCLVLDGLFLAVNIKAALEKEWKFNESFMYHHYDISSCLDANEKRLKMGTYPIYVTHNSPGLRDLNDPDYQKSKNKFAELYNK